VQRLIDKCKDTTSKTRSQVFWEEFSNISAFCSEHFFACLQAWKRLHERQHFPMMADGKWQLF
jgi:hypothetical protein